jgi:hypothetical protein
MELRAMGHRCERPSKILSEIEIRLGAWCIAIAGQAPRPFIGMGSSSWAWESIRKFKRPFRRSRRADETRARGAGTAKMAAPPARLLRRHGGETLQGDDARETDSNALRDAVEGGPVRLMCCEEETRGETDSNAEGQLCQAPGACDSWCSVISE